MKNYARGIIEDASDRDSDDIIQDVMTGVFERADISRPIDNAAAYIYRSLRNRIIDIMRVRKEPVVSIDDDTCFTKVAIPDESIAGPEILFERNEILEAINEAVMKLPEELKTVFIMNEIEGRTYREISGITGIPPGTLMARKSRAMNILKGQLSNLKIFMED